MNTKEPIRMPAEWESAATVLMALPDADTDWRYMLPQIQTEYRNIILVFTSHGQHVTLLTHSREEALAILPDVSPQLLNIVEMPFNDTWARDYGPITVERFGRTRTLDFGFNGWGLKFASDRDNLVNLHLRDAAILASDSYRNERDFELEGGSIDTDGHGTLLTTSRCLCSPNRNGGKSKAELSEILHTRLGVTHVLWLDHGALEGDDTDSHVDTLCRMAPHDIILFTGCRNADDPQFEELLRMRAQLTLFRTPEGLPYNLVELPLPDPIYDEDGQRLPATYANYLVTPTHVFMPTYRQPLNDHTACQIIKVAFPDHKVVPVECIQLIRQHGSLHCSTMQLPDKAVAQIPLN